MQLKHTDTAYLHNFGGIWLLSDIRDIKVELTPS